jgi:hypothetical protein
MKPDFQAMSQSELRSYIIAHPDDVEAFETLADRAYANPNPQWYQPQDIGRFTELLEQDRATKSAGSTRESTTQ